MDLASDAHDVWTVPMWRVCVIWGFEISLDV